MARVDLSWAGRIGGRLSLDFINTRGSRLSDQASEHLTDYETLLAWAVYAGAIDEAAMRGLRRHAAAQPSEAAAVVAEAQALRESIFATFTAAAAGKPPPPTDLARLNAHLERASKAPLVVCRDGSSWERQWRCADALTAPLDPIVRDAADLLLTDAQRQRIHFCESDDGCGWVFLDQTKSGTRRWCDMKSCGNRAKARRHYARQKTKEPS
jgi:predicted RNA-binding Zn ribbon-like protein